MAPSPENSRIVNSLARLGNNVGGLSTTVNTIYNETNVQIKVVRRGDGQQKLNFKTVPSRYKNLFWP